MKKNILLLWGGGGTEHDISGVSANYVFETLKNIDLYNVFKVQMTKSKKFILDDLMIFQICFNKFYMITNAELHF